jgi:hypothetical protein
MGDFSTSRQLTIPTGLNLPQSPDVSLTYDAAFTLFGGCAPAVLSGAGATRAGVYAPAWFVMLMTGIPALLALHFRPSERLPESPSSATEPH